uniref:Uncharacterized protein n=1 Tax=Coccidioides posadasii RMSCC 3488 TaxID=454284 RepID=A0A0J6FCQ1_COCPO|nr:hypothetical protein CPAG_04390 [Coccidioides posadasii RMSCC 3488]
MLSITKFFSSVPLLLSLAECPWPFLGFRERNMAPSYKIGILFPMEGANMWQKKIDPSMLRSLIAVGSSHVFKST